MHSDQLFKILTTIEIETDFIEGQLQDLLDSANLAGTSYFPVLVVEAIRRHDCSTIHLTEVEMDARIRGESLDDEPLIMEPWWQLARPIRDLLVNQFGADETFLTKESLNFKDRTRKGPVHKQTRSLHWGRTFLEYFITAFVITSEIETKTEKPGEPSGSTAQADAISNIVRGLAKRFSLSDPHWYPTKWQPSVRFGIAMRHYGILPGATFDIKYLGPFRNQCLQRKTPLSHAEFEYRKYLLDQRERLFKLLEKYPPSGQ